MSDKTKLKLEGYATIPGFDTMLEDSEGSISNTTFDKHLASFLGISPLTFLRIKKKLSEDIFLINIVFYFCKKLKHY